MVLRPKLTQKLPHFLSLPPNLLQKQKSSEKFRVFGPVLPLERAVVKDTNARSFEGEQISEMTNLNLAYFEELNHISICSLSLSLTLEFFVKPTDQYNRQRRCL